MSKPSRGTVIYDRKNRRVFKIPRRPMNGKTAHQQVKEKIREEFEVDSCDLFGGAVKEDGRIEFRSDYINKMAHGEKDLANISRYDNVRRDMKDKLENHSYYLVDNNDKWKKKSRTY